MSIKQDQYTVIEYTQREAAAIKTRARKMVNEKCKNTCYVTVGTFARRGLSSTAKTLRSLSGVRGSEY